MPKQRLQPPDRTHVRERTYRRDSRLRKLGYASYAEYIHSPAWMEVKCRYWASDLPQDCAECGRPRELMHHKTYERVGEERLSDLMPLCWKCHGRLHDLERDGIVSLDFTGVIDEERALEGRRLLAQQIYERTTEVALHKAEARADKEAYLATLSIAERIRQAKVAGTLITSTSEQKYLQSALYTLNGAFRKKRPRPRYVIGCLERLEGVVYGWHEPRRRIPEHVTKKPLRRYPIEREPLTHYDLP